jgi:DNA-binding NarL/FixJ family response regulator
MLDTLGTLNPPSVGRIQARKKVISPATGTSELVVRVLCVDDHLLLAEGMRVQVSLDPELEFVGHLPDATHLLEAVERTHPDIVTMDIEMPGPDVFEAADQLQRKFPDVRFVLLSAHIRDSLLAAAYRCGASGYFSKGEDLLDIMDGLKRIVHSKRGTFIVGPKVMVQCPSARAVRSSHRTRRAATESAAPISAVDRLTSREIEVLRLIGSGKSRVEIAQVLTRSPKTVDGHQERMMKKLGIETRSELMRFAIREGIAQA